LISISEESTTTSFRASNGEAIRSLLVENASVWLPYADFHPSCAIVLEVAVNAPDFDNPAEARDFLAALEDQARVLQRRRDHQAAVVVLASSFADVLPLLSALEEELSSESISRFRASADAALPVLRELSLVGDLSTAERESIDRFRYDLDEHVRLLERVDCTGTGACAGSIGDRLGARVREAAEILRQYATVYGEELAVAAAAERDLAAREHEVLGAQIELARQELAPWLGH
jgi:hypothetical protein